MTESSNGHGADVVACTHGDHRGAALTVTFGAGMIAKQWETGDPVAYDGASDGRISPSEVNAEAYLDPTPCSRRGATKPAQ